MDREVCEHFNPMGQDCRDCQRTIMKETIKWRGQTAVGKGGRFLGYVFFSNDRWVALETAGPGTAKVDTHRTTGELVLPSPIYIGEYLTEMQAKKATNRWLRGEQV